MDLPVTLYESKMRVEGESVVEFEKVQYFIETLEAERIAVDHAVHFSDVNSDEASGIFNLIKVYPI